MINHRAWKHEKRQPALSGPEAGGEKGKHHAAGLHVFLQCYTKQQLKKDWVLNANVQT